MTAETPKRGGCFGRSIVTVVIVLIVACVVCVGAVFVVGGPAITKIFNAVAAPLTTSNDFMTALIAKDYTKAYGYLDPTAQADLGGSPEGMQQKFESSELVPTAFTVTNFQLGDNALVNGTGTFSGKSKYVYILLQKNGDNWIIINLKINDDAPTATPAGTP